MFSRLKSAVRFFVIGFAVGVLFAPREGTQTRQLLADKFGSLRQSAEELTMVAVSQEADATSSKSSASAPAHVAAPDQATVTDKPAPKRTTRRSRAVGK